MAMNWAGVGLWRRASRTDSSFKSRETLARAFTWGPRRFSGETRRMKRVAGSPSIESKSMPALQTPQEATSWSSWRVLPWGMATPFPMPVDIMDSRWRTLLRISPFVSTRCADSRSKTSSLMADSLSRARRESEIASSFSSSDSCIGSPAVPGTRAKGTGGASLRPRGHATCVGEGASSGKRPGQPLQPQRSLPWIVHPDPDRVAGVEFAGEEPGGQGVLDPPLDQSTQGARAEDRVVALAGQEIQSRVVRLEGDLLGLEPALHLRDLQPHDLAQRLGGERLEDQDLVDPVQKLGPEMPPQRHRQAVAHGLARGAPGFLD